MSVEIASKAYEVADVEEFTELAYERGWTDGLPVLPPTERKILEMLDYIKRDPQELIGVIPSGEGMATVEKIAINCVMAGCKPEYLPVVITAVQAMLDDRFELMRCQATTAGPAPLAIISGPVVKKLDFNYGEGAFTGTGHRANSTIGRAIRLILWNVGLGRPGQMSHATWGHPARYCYLIAERPRDDGNPWEELHVTTAGLKPDDSAVTMFPVGQQQQANVGAGLLPLDDNLFTIAQCICDLGQIQQAQQRMVVMNPQIAGLLAEAGWSKDQVREALLERAKRRLGDIKRTAGTSVTTKYHWSKLVPLDADDDFMVPVMVGLNQMQILVSGGWPAPASQCCILHRSHGEMVTRKIDWNWD